MDKIFCKDTLLDLQCKLAEVEAMVVMHPRGHDTSPLHIIDSSLKQIDILSNINGLECHDEFNKLRDRYKKAEQVFLKGTGSGLDQTFFEPISMEIDNKKVVVSQLDLVLSTINGNYTTFYVYPRLVKKSNLKIIQAKKLESILNSMLFHRINRKMIVNLMHVEQIDNTGSITMRCSFNGNEIRQRVSRGRLTAFKLKFEAFLKMKARNFPLAEN